MIFIDGVWVRLGLKEIHLPIDFITHKCYNNNSLLFLIRLLDD